jgi:organic radical activating enzyme
LFSVSPKLDSSGNGEFPKELLLAWLEVAKKTTVQWKFVIANEVDALEVAKMIKSVRQDIPKDFPIIFQPEESANNYNQLPSIMSEAFAEAGVKPGYLNIRYIPQTHKIYGWR